MPSSGARRSLSTRIGFHEGIRRRTLLAALIPPVPELDLAAGESFHLLLSHLCNRKAYREFYLKEKAFGAYLVLDNSAHEFKSGSMAHHLLDYAADLNVDEVVVPDVLAKATATLDRSIMALDYWVEHQREKLETLHPRFMLVPQGEDVRAWRSCLFGLMMKWHRLNASMPEVFDQPPTIGVSKDYDDDWIGGTRLLLLDHIRPLVEKDKVQVHLLGWAANLWRLNDFALEFPWVRSTDSAKPFVYGLKGIMLDPENETPPVYPKRSETYFDTTMTNHQRKVSGHNMGVFQRLAEGRYTHITR